MLSFKILVFVLFLCGTVDLSESENRKCPDIDVYCVCGQPPNERIHVFGVKGERFKKLVSNCSHDVLVKNVCFSHSCSTGYVDLNLKQPFEKEHNEIPQISSKFPVKFQRFPEQGSEGSPKQTRFRRFPKTCNDSLSTIKNMIATCWAWPDYLTCEFKCAHGYALRERGNVLQEATRNCREKDNYWRPTPKFPNCKPFIHCETFLVSPGTLTCKVEHTKPSYCEISCLPYDEHDATPLKRYECLDEEYDMSLPHCASVNKTTPLIGRPHWY